MNVWSKTGSSRVIDSIARTMASGEVAHAWLLLGPAGAGKRAVAMAMAAAMNCQAAPGEGCGTCSSCSRILRRRHPDVHHIVPEGALIPVDVVRETIVPEASRSPFEASVKVFVIEEAERMNEPAQNALLKTLEEPQPDTVFVLVSAHEEPLLETIRSRCRVVRLDPVPESRIVELLEEDGAEPEVALLAARISDGDFDRARELAEDSEERSRRSGWLSFVDRLVSLPDALDVAAEVIAEAKEAVRSLEATHKQEVAELAEALGERRGTATARNALTKRHKRELKRAEEETIAEALGTFATFYRDVVAWRHGGADAAVNIDRLPDIERWAATVIPDAAFISAASRCIAAAATQDSNANPLLQMEAAMVELVRSVPAKDLTPTW